MGSGTCLRAHCGVLSNVLKTTHLELQGPGSGPPTCALPRLRVALQGPRVTSLSRGWASLYIMGRPAAEKQEGPHMWELWAPRDSSLLRRVGLGGGWGHRTRVNGSCFADPWEPGSQKRPALQRGTMGRKHAGEMGESQTPGRRSQESRASRGPGSATPDASWR